jgi:hypothetical protein
MEKLIAALLQHHKYHNYQAGSHLNCEPIGCNALARLAEVSTGAASQFFHRHFQSHKQYKQVCRREWHLYSKLRMLAGEEPSEHTLGDKAGDIPA